MRTPAQCRTLEHIRTEVNAIDKAMVKLVAQRSRYALAALAFKTDVKSVGDPTHRRRLFAQRKAWAAQFGANDGLVRRIYQAIVAESKRVHLAGLRARRRAAAGKTRKQAR